MATAEHRRLSDHGDRSANWKLWGPYLSERAWGTVREDYSADGEVWDYLPHDHARSRAYRWNEDGLAGVSDRSQYLCFAPALWNGTDEILKERLFGLTGTEGNHGEDVKESYFYLDSTPTHSSMRMLYKYPQAEFPYADLVTENGQRGRDEPEYELADTGVFEGGRYFDVTVEYAKAAPDDLAIVITVANRGPRAAPLWVLPTLWFRNTWSWGYPAGPMGDVPGRPGMSADGDAAVVATHPVLGRYRLHAEAPDDLLFTENETNAARIFGTAGAGGYVKDAFHRHVVDEEEGAVNPQRAGTKAAFVYRAEVASGEEATFRLRLAAADLDEPFAGFDDIVAQRRAEADAFYETVHPDHLDEEGRRIQRQALAGMLWSKQLYYYDVGQWLRGDPVGPEPPDERRFGRNAGWEHLNNFDVLSMPDAWEYPWYASWDLAFHCVPLALVDAEFAKRQLVLMTREWYMHPNGQLPAYEWSFGDANPPTHAWAAWQVYRMDAEQSGTPDRAFLEGVFHKLLLNFTWWVNRKDADGNNVFQGGFLGLDNISVIDRSSMELTGGHIDQSDGTAWMAFFTLEMLEIALELAKENAVYQGLATKFYEHFLAIAAAMTTTEGPGLWSEEDGFFYDVLHLPDGSNQPLRVRSMVGLMALVATVIIEPDTLDHADDFVRRMRWFSAHRPALADVLRTVDSPGNGGRRMLSIVDRSHLQSMLRYLADEGEFLSPHGVRSLSRAHRDQPFRIDLAGQTHTVGYEPGESQTPLFGGNSNWRGPVWFPVNYLIIRALRRYHRYYGDDLTVEFPTGSGTRLNLDGVADQLVARLTGLFRQDAGGERPALRSDPRFANDPHWRDLLLFHEYFDGDTGTGLGAGHQTGWTGLVATLLAEGEGR